MSAADEVRDVERRPLLRGNLSSLHTISPSL